jgi:ferric-dicitrate binding protein FerR (iron transport regulator)
MNEISKAIADLILRHLNDELNDHEKQELDRWVQQSDDHQRFFRQFTDEKNLAETLSEYDASKDIVYEKIIKAIPGNSQADTTSNIRWINPRRLTAIAASILLLASALLWWNIDRNNNQLAESNLPATQRDRQPAFEGAILKLADGKEIILDDTKDGAIAKEGSTQIIKQGGLLSYNSNDAAGKVLYNTLSTPKGRIYKLSLPDGTKVWLNAASSIRFPTVFTGNQRNVEISGEAYFEVTKDMQMPFHVKVNDYTTIEVLGTEFNVNAYDNEDVLHTTLITGAVKLLSRGRDEQSYTAVLKPGQQAQWKNVHAIQAFKLIQEANIEKVIGWKDGYFSFDDLTLEELMREVERWYDVEVVYEKGIPAKAFFGKVSRNLSLLDFMEGLKDWGVRFRLEGRKLIVTGVE